MYTVLTTSLNNKNFCLMYHVYNINLFSNKNITLLRDDTSVGRQAVKLLPIKKYPHYVDIREK